MAEWLLVTGAGKRLGRAVALAAAGAGRNVVVHYNASSADAEAVAAEARAMGAGAVTVAADLADPNAAGLLIDAAANAAGSAITALVNTAAIFEHDLVADAEYAALDAHMRVNAWAPSVLARNLAAALPDGQVGAVVNFLDFKLAQPYPDHFTYTLSKYALAGATELMARALAPQLRVNAVAPGFVLPAPGQSDEDYRRLHANTPLRRGPSPQDVADAALYLLGAQAVTGQTVFVDAGLRFRSRDRDLAFS